MAPRRRDVDAHYAARGMGVAGMMISFARHTHIYAAKYRDLMARRR